MSVRLFDPKIGAHAPVRVTVYLERELYEKAEAAAACWALRRLTALLSNSCRM